MIGWWLAPLVTVVASVLPPQAASQDTQILPGVRVGPVSATSSAASLRQDLGAEAVVDADISLGEGTFEAGTLVFPQDHARSIGILWHDPERQERPRRILVCYSIRLEPGTTECDWRTPEGIGVETRLSELETINGRPFSLVGFEWDYAGTVTSWRGGALDALLNPPGWRAWVRLSPRTDQDGNWVPALGADDLRPLMGDRDLESSDAALQRLDPGVYEIAFEISDPCRAPS